MFGSLLVCGFVAVVGGGGAVHVAVAVDVNVLVVSGSCWQCWVDVVVATVGVDDNAFLMLRLKLKNKEARISSINEEFFLTVCRHDH